MHELTLLEKAENIDLAERLWRERVTPDKVVADLCIWSCNTQACFGGHLASWPEFQEMGVYAAPGNDPVWGVGAPLMGDTAKPYEVALHLFGDGYIFDARGAHVADPYAEDDDTSDYQVVLNRLAHARSVIDAQIQRALA